MKDNMLFHSLFSFLLLSHNLARDNPACLSPVKRDFTHRIVL